MAHAQKQDFVFRANGPVRLNRPVGVSSVDCWQPRCAASAVVMLDTACSEVVWRVLATHFIRQFPLHFPSRASPCAITFQLDSTTSPILPHRIQTPVIWPKYPISIWHGICLISRGILSTTFRHGTKELLSIVAQYSFFLKPLPSILLSLSVADGLTCLCHI